MTRDPARIDPILADLRRYWHAAPDLRLGQMVMGLLDLSGAPRYGEFNAEDDKVAAYLAAWAAANPPPPDHRDTLPPEIEAAIADAGQALVDAWDSAQSGPPHRFAVYTDPEGDPEVAAGWMAMARMHAAALAAAREAGRREVLERARHLSIGEGVGDATPIEKALQLYREETMEWENCDHPSGAAKDAERRQFDAYLALLAAIAADKAALDATWRAHDLERDAEVAQAQAATHEACAALQAICAALHVTPPTGSTYCAEAVAMVLERVAADKARAVEGMRPVLSQADAERLVDAFDEATFDRSNPARTALLAALTGTGEIRRQMDAAAVEMCADCAALTGAGGGR